MSKHELKHYPFGSITICGIFIGERDILAETPDKMNCHRCQAGLDNAIKCSEGKQLKDLQKGQSQREKLVQVAKKKEEIKTARRADERAAHLALKAQVEAGLSSQAARALAAGGRPLRKGCIKD